MTASPERLPPALSSMWRLLKLGYRHEPRMMVASFALSQLAALPDAFLPLWLKFLGRGVLAGDRRLVLACALGLGASATATWFLATVSTRVQRRFRDRVTIALESHVARLQAEIATIAHQERPLFLDRLSVLRNQVFVLDHMYMSVFSTGGWLLRLGVAIALLVSIHPALVLLAAFAVPTAFTSAWRPGVERAAEERRASSSRLAMHLFTTATTAPPGKEVRVTGIGPRLVTDRRRAWEWWYGPVAAARWSSALWHALAWTTFGCAYVGAIVFVSSDLRAPAADVLLVLAAGAQLSAYIGATVGEIGFLRGIWLDGSRRLAWLEDYAASVVASADVPAPARLQEGIRFEGVSFAYPGTDRLVLEAVDLDLPAGSVVALVGENGAGKTTLVKLLCKLYEPTAGRILVDGAPLDRVRTRRVAKAPGRRLPGLLPLRASRPPLGGSRRRAAPGRRAGRLERRRAGRGRRRGGAPAPGPRHPARAHLARGRRGVVRPVAEARPRPRLHARRAAPPRARRAHGRPRRGDRARALRALRRGSPTGPRLPARTGRPAASRSSSPHRFSTVRMADRIVVLDGSRVAQVGSHEELMAKGGPYAELYAIQAAAYR